MLTATCSDQGGGSLRCQLTGTLTKGSSFIYSLPYDATQVGIWENTVTLSVQPDNNGQNDVATATVNVTEPAPPPPITGVKQCYVIWHKTISGSANYYKS